MEAQSAGLRLDAVGGGGFNHVLAVAEVGVSDCLAPPPPIQWFKGLERINNEAKPPSLCDNIDFKQWQCGRTAQSLKPMWRLTLFPGFGSSASRALSHDARWAQLLQHCNLGYRAASSGTGDDLIRVAVRSTARPVVELRRPKYIRAFQACAFARWMAQDARREDEVKHKDADRAAASAASPGWGAATPTDGAAAIAPGVITDRAHEAMSKSLDHIISRYSNEKRVPAEHLIMDCRHRLAWLARAMAPCLDSDAKIGILGGASSDAVVAAA